MRRILIVAAGLILALCSWNTAPGYQVKIGAAITTDLYYGLLSGSSYLGADGTRDIRQPDLTRFSLESNWSALEFFFHSNDKSTGVHVQFLMRSGPAAGATQFLLAYAYGWYRFGRCRLEVGFVDNLFAAATYAPYAALGFGSMPDGAGAFYNFGKLYSGRYAQAALYYQPGRWTFMVAIGNVPNNSANWPAVDVHETVFVMNSIYPRLDLAVEYRGRYWSICPGLSIYRTEWESMAGLHLEDDHVWSFALVIPFRLVFGRFGFTGEVGLGKNWIVPNMLNTWQGAVWWGGPTRAAPGTPRLKAADTMTYTACLGFFYRVGRMTLWLSAGWQMEQNGSSDAYLTWRHGQNVRFALVTAAPYRVNRHFSIAPEIGYYFYGWDPTQDVGDTRDLNFDIASTTADRGSAWIIGLRFVIRF